MYLWLGFEMGLTPALGLREAQQVRLVGRLALAADHLLYGLVLSQTRRWPSSLARELLATRAVPRPAVGSA